MNKYRVNLGYYKAIEFHTIEIKEFSTLKEAKEYLLQVIGEEKYDSYEIRIVNE